MNRFIFPRRILANAAVFLAFVGLTVMMTWPWVRSLRDYAPDAGDSYLNTWILWWDYHQTFQHPLHLFDANILYPYQHTLAFSEHNYGIALCFFLFFAAGLRPLTVHGIAVLTGFAFSGYGAFRLTNTLSGSRGAAWVAGVAFAFVPFRFHHLPHVTYLFSGWMPLLLEALVLYTRRPDAKRAAWLGLAFLMNGLTCIHWFLLTLIPMGMTTLLLVSRYGLWRNRRFWLWGLSAILAASLALLPFLIPYVWVKRLYGFQRDAQEARLFSAHLINWLMVDWQNKFWKGLGSVTQYRTELALFPGFVPPLLAMAAFRFRPRDDDASKSRHASLILVLDAVVVIGLITALLCVGYGQLQPKIFGLQLFHLASATPALLAAGCALIIRVLLGGRTLFVRLRTIQLKLNRPAWLTESLEIGLVWTILGFIGSFGMNFVFHRMLFEYVPLFRSIRVPARWAMICFVGLALLAGAGAVQLTTRIAKQRPRIFQIAAFVTLVIIIMCEQRSAPLQLIHGAVDPDQVTLKLRDTPMRGGILELPAGVGEANYLYTLRAADHGRPLVDGVSGFLPPVERAVEEMSNTQPIDPLFIDLLEAIPVSYVVVHHASMTPEADKALKSFLDDGVATGRLLLVARFNDHRLSDDLYALTKTERGD
jgi:hypothetical protein